jgi:integrase/recombinase XerD
MALGKQAKTLSKGQIEALLNHAGRSRQPIRNKTIILLSLRAGLRAKEISCLTWEMVTESDGSIGQAIHLQDRASKGRSGRIIPLNSDLRSSLVELQKSNSDCRPSLFVIKTERMERTSSQSIVNLFYRWYTELGFSGCSSHSGRRTFITNAARRISTVGGSLRDIQLLAGHSNLATTQRYIEANGDAQRRIVELL